MNFFHEFRAEIKLLLVVALVAVILAVAGILLLQQAGLKPFSPTPIVETPPPPTPSPQAQATEDWQTYRNEEFGFEFRYPSTWSYTALDTPENLLMFAPVNIIAKVEQSLENIESDKSWTLWVTVYEKTLFEGVILPSRDQSYEFGSVVSSDVDIGGIRGKRYVFEYIKDWGSYRVGDKAFVVDILLKDGSYLSFRLFDDQHLETFDQILSTFRFISTN